MILSTLGPFASHCKVNLTLDVFAPRPDGFHELDSIVAKWSPHDELLLFTGLNKHGGVIYLKCDDPVLPTDERNLACKAAQVFRDEFDPRHSWNFGIEMRKRLPYQAGLGGGSSNAATVIQGFFDFIVRSGLEELSTKPEHADMDVAVLCSRICREIGAKVGSDVPLFLIPGAVRMRGRGDLVEPLATNIPALHGVLVKPHVGVPTPAAFALLDAVPNRVPGTATQTLLSVLQSNPNDLSAIASALGNDFEQAILPAFPEVAEAHRAVQGAGSLRALLCGSGSAVFGLALSAEHAGEMTRALRESQRFAWVEVAESL